MRVCVCVLCVCACLPPDFVLAGTIERRVFLDGPVKARLEVVRVLEGQRIERVSVQVLHESLPFLIVAVSAPVDDKAPFRVRRGSKLGADAVGFGQGL